MRAKRNLADMSRHLVGTVNNLLQGKIGLLRGLELLGISTAICQLFLVKVSNKRNSNKVDGEKIDLYSTSSLILFSHGYGLIMVRNENFNLREWISEAVPIVSQESVLLWDLLNCLKGIDGTYITSESLKSQYDPVVFKISPDVGKNQCTE